MDTDGNPVEGVVIEDDDDEVRLQMRMDDVIHKTRIKLDKIFYDHNQRMRKSIFGLIVCLLAITGVCLPFILWLWLMFFRWCLWMWGVG